MGEKIYCNIRACSADNHETLKNLAGTLNTLHCTTIYCYIVEGGQKVTD